MIGTAKVVRVFLTEELGVTMSNGRSRGVNVMVELGVLVFGFRGWLWQKSFLTITSGPTSVGANAAAYSIPCEKRHLHPKLCAVDFVVEVMDDVDSSGALQCSDYRARSILLRNTGSVRTGTRTPQTFHGGAIRERWSLEGVSTFSRDSRWALPQYSTILQ